MACDIWQLIENAVELIFSIQNQDKGGNVTSNFAIRMARVLLVAVVCLVMVGCAAPTVNELEPVQAGAKKVPGRFCLL